jgi:sulfide:quinone oxidoreductase
MKNVVVLGGSFGGLTAALELRRLLGRDAQITVVSEDDRFVFMPSLPWLIMGQRRPQNVTLKVPDILTPKGISFLHEAAERVDPDACKVFTTKREIPYDYLVISTGAYLAFDEIPGLGPDKGYTNSTFTLDHAVSANLAWQKALQYPGPIIVGSAQGVSCFGPSYELAYEIDAELRRRKMRNRFPIIYLTSEPYLGHMGVGGLGNSKRFIEDTMAEREIKTLVSQTIEEVVPGEIRLKDGTKLAYKFAMIAPPFKGVPAVASLGNPRGFIPVDKQYRHTKHKNIFAIGVAVAIAPPEPTPVPTGVPKTGFMTVRMAKTVAAVISSEIKNTTPPSPEEMNVICIMDMGNTGALMMADPVLPPRQKSFTKKGYQYRLLKIAFERYFLWKMKRGFSGLP